MRPVATIAEELYEALQRPLGTVQLGHLIDELVAARHLQAAADRAGRLYMVTVDVDERRSIELTHLEGQGWVARPQERGPSPREGQTTVGATVKAGPRQSRSDDPLDKAQRAIDRLGSIKL